MIGRYVCERLKPFDLNVIAYDPFVSKEEAAILNVELCTLEEVFHRADVVSLHTPWLKETEGLITGEHIHSMKKWASFINTSRGAIVREPEMVEVLRQRSDLQAVLDVTFPEPPLPGSLLYSLPNVVLTPHISGASSKKDIARMGSFAAEELRLYLNGEPLKWEITREKAQIMA
jgi:phosphoglycerate dehydrogenase-like enzyme